MQWLYGCQSPKLNYWDRITRSAFIPLFDGQNVQEKPMRKLLIALTIFTVSASVHARDACTKNSDCSGTDQCVRYSSTVRTQCNAIGRIFGCKSSSGACSLFCDNDLIYALRCTAACTADSQCQPGESCKGSSTQKRCTRL